MNRDNGKFIWIVAVTGIVFDALCICSYFLSGKLCENIYLELQRKGGSAFDELNSWFFPSTMLVPTIVLCTIGLIIVLLLLSYSGINRKLVLHIKTIAVTKVIFLVAASCYTGIYLVIPAIITQEGTNPLVMIQYYSLIFQPIVMVLSYVAFTVVCINFKRHKSI